MGKTQKTKTKKINRILPILTMVIAVLSLCLLGACSTAQNNASDTNAATNENETTVNENTTATDNENETNGTKRGERAEKDHKTLIAYFSPDGNAKKIADIIASQIDNADEYEIVPVEPYTEEDLSTEDRENKRPYKEQHDFSIEVMYQDLIDNMSDYDTVFFGFPIWYDNAPSVVYTWLQDYEFTEKTMIPFAVSDEYQISDIEVMLSNMTYDGDWADGKTFSEQFSEDEVTTWIDDLREYLDF